MPPIRPPTMTMAKGRCESEPMPCDSAAGSRPSVATSMVIMMGRRRSTAPSMAASSIEWPRARSWLMYSSMMTPVCTETPNSARKPDAGRHAEMGVGDQQRQQAAERRHGHVGQHQHRPLERVEHGVEDHEDHQDRDGHDHHQAGVASASGFRIRRPNRCGSLSGSFTCWPTLRDGFFHRAAQVAPAHAVLDGHVARVAFAVDLRRAVAHCARRRAAPARRARRRAPAGGCSRWLPWCRGSAADSAPPGRSAARPASTWLTALPPTAVWMASCTSATLIW